MFDRLYPISLSQKLLSSTAESCKATQDGAPRASVSGQRRSTGDAVVQDADEVVCLPIYFERTTQPLLHGSVSSHRGDARVHDPVVEILPYPIEELEFSVIRLRPRYQECQRALLGNHLRQGIPEFGKCQAAIGVTFLVRPRGLPARLHNMCILCMGMLCISRCACVGCAR